ncbi:hypothetical protein WJ972_26285 [Achromobacter insuavis]
MSFLRPFLLVLLALPLPAIAQADIEDAAAQARATLKQQALVPNG